jgi:3-methylcrotonyl-CoA carboxylase alpha subunit
MKVTPAGAGIYRVDDGRRTWTVAVAGPPENRWVWIDGQVTRLDPPVSGRTRGRTASDELSAPMPATVVKVLVQPGAVVARGDTLLMLEAMKMELPIRTPRAGVVKTINCQAGELVQPGHQLIILEDAAAAGSQP